MDEPATLWISLALAVISGICALWRWRRGMAVDESSPFAPPWRWPAYWLGGFALLNAAIALGVAIGFSPRPLR